MSAPANMPWVVPALKRSPHDISISFDALTRIVCEACDVSRVDLQLPSSEPGSRVRTVAWPRMALMWLGYRWTRLSFPALGVRLGNRDHATVIHGYRTVDKGLHPELTAWCQAVESMLLAIGYGRPDEALTEAALTEAIQEAGATGSDEPACPLETARAAELARKEALAEALFVIESDLRSAALGLKRLLAEARGLNVSPLAHHELTAALDITAKATARFRVGGDAIMIPNKETDYV